MTIGQKIKQLEEQLASVSDAPRIEAELLCAFALGKKRVGFEEKRSLFPGKSTEALDALLQRRLGGEPIQYILGEWEFMGLPFFTEPCALIPRQDTETLVEAALGLIRERGYRTALDICTGTGCIAVSLKKLGGLERVSASDISPECVSLAERNAERNGVGIEFSVRDLFEGHGRYDLVTANPPYINNEDMARLQREVKREPALALCGGEDGLDLYRRIAESRRGHINPGGAMLLEVGMGQARQVAELFAGAKTDIIKDLCGVERVVAVYESR